jgi:predicted nuclease of predicted toxin-antitoxin system
VKVLLDSCVWGGARVELQSFGFDAVWAGDWSPDPGDEQILERAHAEQRVLVTLDKDFGELAIVRGKPHSGIIRLVGISARQQGNICRDILSAYPQELAAGAIITVDMGRLRLRPGSTA